jgi:thiol-disulfide isomerase/thioredoxin
MDDEKLARHDTLLAVRETLRAFGKTFLIAAVLLLATVANAAATNEAASVSQTNDPKAAVGEAVQQLLETGNAKKFAESMVATLEENNRWNTLTNELKHTSKPWPSTPKLVADEQGQVEASAKLFLETARRAGVNRARVKFAVKEVSVKMNPPRKGPPIRVDHGGLPHAQAITVVLTGDSPDVKLEGEYKVVINGAALYPTGWRTFTGLRWADFPAGLADTGVARQVRVVEKTESGGSEIDANDDPVLADLGHAIIRFVQERDEDALAEKVIPSFEEIQKNMAPALERAGAPTQAQLESGYKAMRETVLESARQLLKQSDDLGIDFAEAKIELRGVTAERTFQSGTLGGLVGLDSPTVRITMSVTSERNTKAGKPVSGEYMVATGHCERRESRWELSDAKLHWEKFPEGLLTENERNDLATENYAAQKGALPPGATAPDVELTRVDNGGALRLSDLRGKVVLLDFWATWCVPCQAPMAELQKLRTTHPEWKDRVEIVTVSVDDELNQAKKRLEQKGWTNAVNTWAGAGGWTTKAPKRFGVTGIPTEYVIGTDGKVKFGGGPADADLEKLVASALGK